MGSYGPPPPAPLPLGMGSYGLPPPGPLSPMPLAPPTLLGGHHHHRHLEPKPDITPLPATDALKVVMILDESGSMASIKKKIRDEINALIEKQQKEKTDGTTFTLVKFNDNVKTIIDNVPMAMVKPLDEKDYAPDGCTALFDAVGLTADRFREQPKVIMVIVTDGAENASRYYANVRSIIDKYQTEKKWNFVYLSCDYETFQQGVSMGYSSSSQSSNIQYNKEDMARFLSHGLSEAISSGRSGAVEGSINDVINSQAGVSKS